MAEEERRAENEAAGWLARLRSRSISNQELADFALWRRDPDNAEAYRRAEALWEASGGLRHDPDIGEELGRIERRRRPSIRLGRPTRAVSLALVTGMALALAALVGLARGIDGSSYRTAVGESSIVRLEDGSRMQLDGDSDADVSVTSSERHIRLERGQGYFEVRHEPGRPFVVEAPGGVSVTALGTDFNVDVTGDGSTRVSLLEGSVSVDRLGSRLTLLRPGEAISVDRSGRLVRLRLSAEEVAGWREGRLTFRDTPLSEAVDAVNRSLRQPVRIARADAARERISGEFGTGDPVGFVSAVNTLLGSGTLERSSQP